MKLFFLLTLSSKKPIIMKIKLMFIISLFLFFFNCKEKESSFDSSVNTGEIYTTDFENKKLRDSLQEKAIYSNDTLAYKQLRNIYYLSGNADDFLYNSMIMYNRNNYQSAKEDVIFILNRKEDVDVKTKALIDSNF